MPQRLNIVVMLGGPSAEREVSLRSGEAAARALRRLGHAVTGLDPVPGQWRLPPETEVVFLALHGSYGEDGTIQDELEKIGVPYTGCGPEASRIAFDKALAKERFLAAGVPTAAHVVIREANAPLPSKPGLPLVLKPVRQGSSVGLRFVRSAEEWAEALRHCLAFDREALVEEWISGRETTVGLLDGRPLPIVEVRPKQGSYDYHNKYTSGATEYFCPADFDAATTRRAQEAARAAFECVGGRDYGRVDVIVTRGGEPVVLEVNTLPGLTETSLLPKAAAAAGLTYEDLCQRMIDLALRRSPVAV